MTANQTSIVGVVSDVRRDSEGDYQMNKCCVYGINEEEFQALTRAANVSA